MKQTINQINHRRRKVKAHLKENKKVYIAIGATFVVTVAGFTLHIMRSKPCPMWEGVSSMPNVGLVNTASLKFSNKSTINITTVLDREGRGHPGWPVRNLETKRIFFSQRDAADTFGIGEGTLSSHLNGKFSDANGLHFERVNIIEAK